MNNEAKSKKFTFLQRVQYKIQDVKQIFKIGLKAFV
jgi:hypothetical protein